VTAISIMNLTGMPSLHNLNPLDYQVRGQCWSLNIQAVSCSRSQNSSRILKCTLVTLVCITGESHLQRCEIPPQASAGMCVSQWWTF